MKAGAREPRRSYAISVTLISLVTFVISLLWGLAAPHFSGPDESQHANSIARLVDGGGWPLPYEAEMLGSTWQAVGEAGWPLPDDEYVDPIPQPADRADFLEQSDLPDRSRDGMVQHPPGYYLLGAAAIVVAGGEDLRWDHAMFVLRALSAVLFAMAIPFVAGTVRWATGSRWAGVLGAMFPLLVPWYTASGGRVSNDALLVAATSATIYALVRAWKDPSRRTAMLLIAGFSYGVALFSKGYALILAPLVVVLAVGAAWRAERRAWPIAWRLLAPAAIAFVVGGWWWVRNLILIGTIQPSRYGSRSDRGQEIAHESYSFATFIDTYVTRLNSTFWGRVGYTNANEGGLIVAIAGILLVVTIVLALVFARSRWMLALVLFYPLAIATILFQNAHGIYWDLGDPTRGIQGRYLFSGIAAFALAFAALLHRFFGRRSTRARAICTVLVGAITCTWLTAAMSWSILQRWDVQHRRTPVPLGDPIVFMDVPLLVYGALPIVAGCLLLAAVVFGARVTVTEGADKTHRV